MMMRFGLAVLFLALAASTADAARHAGKPRLAPKVGKGHTVQNSSKLAEVRKTQARQNTTKHAEVSHPAGKLKHNVSTAPHPAQKLKHNFSAEDQLAKFHAGLEAIRKLRGTFAAEATGPEPERVQQLAQGALTTELQRKDSAVWAALEDMFAATTKAMSAMKGSNDTMKSDILKGLEGTIDQKAQALKNVTARVGQEQERQSEEYLLGLLMQHQQDWSVQKQLNVTRSFARDCPTARELLRNHHSDQPLAQQLAKLMDAHKANEVKAKALFLQLAASLYTQ
eukprot:CAMPEP_0171097564 /NCGR_PEP_ID=MMETSP0766_2-20121228/47619_1 /TAXON_ID=439317 /ORGANISM="Gambierdiscus australes, Strain CAWD 149" /LENGTH=281 /DNA_ID=CAMNT_0011556781 /DNA_START=42 /DNA_END=887 /DNA_ORIENTATION=+